MLPSNIRAGRKRDRWVEKPDEGLEDRTANDVERQPAEDDEHGQKAKEQAGPG